MNAFIDISDKLNSFTGLVDYLNSLLKEIKMPCESQNKEKLISYFNNLDNAHPFSKFQLIADNEDTSNIFLVEKKFSIYLKRIPLYFENNKIEMKNALLIKKTIKEKRIEINYYFHLNSFYGFSVKCLNTLKYVGFSLNKNSFSCYIDQEDFSSMFDENIKRESTIFFDKAIILHDFFENTDNQNLMSNIFKFVFEKKTISQQEIDNIFLIHDIDFLNIIDNSYIFDIPDDFYD